jgi:hypothetical protein
MTMILAVVAAVVLIVIGVYFQLTHTSGHVISYKALAVWAAAVAALIAASFLRPPKTG